jgi:hypothetical protein
MAICRTGAGSHPECRMFIGCFEMLCIACIDLLLIFTGEISQNALRDLNRTDFMKMKAFSGHTSPVNGNSHRAIIFATHADPSVRFDQDDCLN